MRPFFILIYIFITCNQAACQNANFSHVEDARIETAYKIMQLLKEGDIENVRKFYYFSLSNDSDETTEFKQEISNASFVINKYGIPTKDQIKIEESANTLNIIFPLFNSDNTNLEIWKAEIIIAFNPNLSPNRIAFFDVTIFRKLKPIKLE